ncbi:hypothetical protein ScPMuIL_000929 [Solemya velum]
MLNIVNYSESSSSESDSEDDKGEAAGETDTLEEKKRSAEADVMASPKRQKRNNDSLPLPLPDGIKQLFVGADGRKDDDLAMHHGKIRSFPHEEGNWATYVYIPCGPDERWLELSKELMIALRPMRFELIEDLHVSLSRTVVIRHHWIQPLVDSLGPLFRKLESTCLQLESISVYTNDERTRSFLSIKVECDVDVLKSYVEIVDTCFKDYSLEKYYSDPSFHISVGWALGDVTPIMSGGKLGELQNILSCYLDKEPDLRFIDVNEIRCKTGNKVYCFPLQTG